MTSEITRSVICQEQSSKYRNSIRRTGYREGVALIFPDETQTLITMNEWRSDVSQTCLYFSENRT